MNQAAPNPEDFMVTSKKEARKLPTPVTEQPRTSWNPNDINRQFKDRVSAPYEKAWAEIEVTS